EVMLDKSVEYKGKKGKVVRVLVDASTGERMLQLAFTDEKGHIAQETVAESEVTFTPEQAVDTGLDSGDTINPPVDTDIATNEALPAVDTYLDGGKDINPAIDTDLDADTEIQAAVNTDLVDGTDIRDAVDTTLDEEEDVLPPVDTSLGETNW